MADAAKGTVEATRQEPVAAEEKKPENGKQARLSDVARAAKKLCDQWGSFVDRQDPVYAYALLDAVDALKKGDLS